MMYRIFAAAFAAGLFAAALVTVVEVFTTTPLILHAETYENAAAAPAQSDHDHSVQDHSALSSEATTKTDHAHDEDEWAPEDGVERFLFTALANCVTGIAFSLLLVVGLTMGQRKADVTKGLLLGAGGFIAFTLSPVLGLAPEVPGMPAADLQLRQIWWVVTVALSIGGLYCLSMTDTLALKALGIVLLIAPHIWGAPHAPAEATLVPAALAAHFAATSITVNALFWALIGWTAPLFYQHFESKQTD